MPVVRTALVLLLALWLPACSGSEEAAIESAHAVFVVRPGCDYFIAQTTGRGYLVAAPSGAYAPRQGDLLVGTLSDGEIRLDVVAARTDDLSPGEPIRIVGHDLALADAQGLYYGYCPLPASPPPAADTTSTF